TNTESRSRCALQRTDQRATLVATYARVARTGDKKGRFTGISYKPSDGPEPSTPPYHATLGQPVAVRDEEIGLLRRFRGPKRSDRLRPVAPSFFHNFPSFRHSAV